MRVSARTEYALLAMMEIAVHQGGTPLQSKDIAARAGIPKPFLDQLLLDLRRSGLIRSIRGPGGGYALGRPASDITVRDVIEVVEGPVLNTQCGIKTPDGSPCRRLAMCALLELWRHVDRSIGEVLSGTTLQDLAERQHHLDGQQMYHI